MIRTSNKGTFVLKDKWIMSDGQFPLQSQNKNSQLIIAISILDKEV